MLDEKSESLSAPCLQILHLRIVKIFAFSFFVYNTFVFHRFPTSIFALGIVIKDPSDAKSLKEAITSLLSGSTILFCFSQRHFFEKSVRMLQ